VLPPHLLLLHPHNILLIKRIVFHKPRKQVSLILREFMVKLGIPIDFDGHTRLLLMIKSLDNLCKAALAEYRNDFKSVQQMILVINNQIAFLIVLNLLVLFEVVHCFWYVI
jgi:hypothetical protein